MADAAIVYQSSDNGAPQVYSSTIGVNFMNVIKTCLTTGYGSKPAAGWTMPYYDEAAGIYVLRNSPNTGSGTYLRLEKTSVAYQFNFSAWRVCTGTGTGDGQVWIPRNVYYQAPTVTSNNTKMLFHTLFWFQTTSSPLPWIMFADEKSFWLLYPNKRYDNGQPSVAMMFAGDFCSFHNLTWPFALFTNYASNEIARMNLCPTYNSYAVINYYRGTLMHMKDYSFLYILDEPHNGYVMAPYIKNTNMSTDWYDIYPHAYPYNGHIFIHRNCFMLYGVPENTAHNQQSDFRFPIGQLPGSPAFLGHCVIEAGQALCGWTPGQVSSYAPTEFWKEVTIDGEQFWMFRTNAAPLLLQTHSGRWRPF